jgi:hypothetical protein
MLVMVMDLDIPTEASLTPVLTLGPRREAGIRAGIGVGIGAGIEAGIGAGIGVGIGGIGIGLTIATATDTDTTGGERVGV